MNTDRNEYNTMYLKTQLRVSNSISGPPLPEGTSAIEKSDRVPRGWKSRGEWNGVRPVFGGFSTILSGPLPEL
jgi:hypothetical protein